MPKEELKGLFDIFAKNVVIRQTYLGNHRSNQQIMYTSRKSNWSCLIKQSKYLKNI